MAALRRRNLIRSIGLVIAGLLVGWLVADRPGALFGCVTGILLAWAVWKGAVRATLVGAVKGICFVALIGPVADWLLSRQPLTEKLPLVIVSGGLLGGALGIKNARPAKGQASTKVPSVVEDNST